MHGWDRSSSRRPARPSDPAWNPGRWADLLGVETLRGDRRQSPSRLSTALAGCVDGEQDARREVPGRDPERSRLIAVSSRFSGTSGPQAGVSMATIDDGGAFRPERQGSGRRTVRCTGRVAEAVTYAQPNGAVGAVLANDISPVRRQTGQLRLLAGLRVLLAVALLLARRADDDDGEGLDPRLRAVIESAPALTGAQVERLRGLLGLTRTRKAGSVLRRQRRRPSSRRAPCASAPDLRLRRAGRVPGSGRHAARR